MPNRGLAATVVSDFLTNEVYDAGARDVVRHAYDVTFKEANGLVPADVAAAVRHAAELASEGRISGYDIVQAVRFHMGL